MRSTLTKFIATTCLITSAFTVSAQAHPWGGPGWERGPGWSGGGYHRHHGGGLAAGLAIGAISGMVIGNSLTPRVISPAYPVAPPPPIYPGYGNTYGYNYGYGYSAPPVIVAPPPPPPIVGPPIYSGW